MVFRSILIVVYGWKGIVTVWVHLRIHKYMTDVPPSIHLFLFVTATTNYLGGLKNDNLLSKTGSPCIVESMYLFKNNVNALKKYHRKMNSIALADQSPMLPLFTLSKALSLSLLFITPFDVDNISALA